MGAPGHGYVGVPAFHIATSQEAAAAGEFGFRLSAENLLFWPKTVVKRKKGESTA